MRNPAIFRCFFAPQASKGPFDRGFTGVLVRLETGLGPLTLEIDTRSAPVTAANFLNYVDAGSYEGGQFHRTVRPDNQPSDAIRIGVIQGSKRAGAPSFGPIPLERTSQTGLRHLDGVLSMARTTPDTATDQFFICAGDQPELDFAGRRNPDGQGFAAFGRLVEGWLVLKRIQMAEAAGQSLNPPVAIVRARRL